MNIQFANPWVLLLLWLAVPAGMVWLAAWHMRARALERFLAPDMRRKLCPAPQPQRFYWQWTLVLLGLLLAVIAAARPQWGLREEKVIQRGRDLVIALDVSRSMLAQDVHPNRLQRAKADIQDLLRELRGDRAALIVFRGKAVQLCPLTTDYAYLEQMLDEVSPESAPRGETDIGDAIVKALDAFENDAGADQAVILISDGEDLAGRARAAAETAAKKGVVIFTVGLGDPQGAKIPSAARANEFMTYQGQAVVSKLQHETLKAIADVAGGVYVPVGTANVKLDKLYRDHLSKLTARDIEESFRRRYVERFQWFLLPSVLAFLAGALLSRGRLAKTGKETHPSADTGGKAPQFAPPTLARVWPLFVPLALVAGLVQAQAPAPAGPVSNDNVRQTAPQTADKMPATVAATNKPPAKPALVGRDGAWRAQRLYRTGAYQDAAQSFLDAMPGQTTALQNNCLYNAGNAFYRAGLYQTAAEKYSELAARQPPDPSPAFYNLGCAVFQLAQQAESAGTNVPPGAHPALLERSGLAFQRALRSHSANDASRANLAVVTNLLPQAREKARLQDLLSRYQGTPPPQLADTMLANQRSLVAQLNSALTNAAPSRIGQMEALAAQQRNNTDLLIPLKLALDSALAQMAASSTSGAPQAAQVARHIEAVDNTMRTAAEQLRNLENEAYRSASKAESGIYNLWKGMAQFPQLLREDIYRQTNAINLTASLLARSAEVEPPAIVHQQNEARELTQLFMERFAQAVPEGGTPPASGCAPPAGTLPTNAIPTSTTAETPEDRQEITAETRTNILALAQQALTLQEQALEKVKAAAFNPALPIQRQAYNLLEEIEKLLPKNKDQNDNQQNQDQDQQQDQQKQEQQKEPPQQDDRQKQDQSGQEPPPQEQQPEEQPQSTPEQKPEQEEKDKEMTPEQAKMLLEKALQREKDHREERERDTYIPPSPMDKDW